MTNPLLVFFALISFLSFGQPGGHPVLAQMHERNKNGMCQYYTFSQKNTHFNNDSVIGESVWHESVGLPDKFRIIFGDSVKGHSVLFRNDSVYHYRRSRIMKAYPDSNTLLLLLGGMYFRELGEVKARLFKAGFDISQYHERDWNGGPVHVLGALFGDERSNQFWVDKNDLRVVRIIEKINDTDTMDMRFESHQKWCNGFVENKVSFRRNGELEQVEEYYDLKVRQRFME